MKRKVFILFIFSLFLTAIQSQETIVSSGNTTYGSGGSISFTIGQIDYINISGKSINISNGVQQSYKISEEKGLKTQKYNTFLCAVYPNPVADFLIVKIESSLFSQYSVSLFDINGKFLKNQSFISQEISIDMGNFISAIYLLQVIHNNKVVKVFRVIKN